MKYRLIAFRGSGGWNLGGVYDLDLEPNGTIILSEIDGPDLGDVYERTFWSRNNDGLFETEDEGTEMLIPIGGTV